MMIHNDWMRILQSRLRKRVEGIRIRYRMYRHFSRKGRVVSLLMSL